MDGQEVPAGPWTSADAEALEPLGSRGTPVRAEAQRTVGTEPPTPNTVAMFRRLILSILLLSFLFFAAATLASFWHVAYYGVVYPSSVESLPPRGANLTIILRGGAVQGWNSGSYYKPGWSLNSGRTRYLQW